MLRAILLLFSLAFLAGCATGPKFTDAAQPQDGKALVYIYRMPNFGMSGVDARFFLGDQKLSQLSADGYTYFYIPAGVYTLAQKWPMTEAPTTFVKLRVRAGETKYFRLETDATPGFYEVRYNWRITAVDPAQGHLEILERRFQEAEIANVTPQVEPSRTVLTAPALPDPALQTQSTDGSSLGRPHSPKMGQ